MTLILTPDDLRTTSLIIPDLYHKAELYDFNYYAVFLHNSMRYCDTIIFQYPNEHRGTETKVLFKK